jgi:hypothetical protein
VRPGAVLVVLLAAAAAWRSLAALDGAAPWIVPDEQAYALLGRGVWQHGELAILGGPTQLGSVLYPVLAGVPLDLGGLGTGYDVLRVLQALALCSTAVVVYAWARTLVAARWALVGAALTLLLPGFVYAGTIGPEALFVPLATLAAWLAVRAFESPTGGNQVLLVAALAVCLLTSLEGYVIAIAVLLAALVRGRLVALAPTWIVLGLFAVTWFVSGAPAPTRSFGRFEDAGEYTAARVVEYVSYHAGALLLLCGIVPLCAVVLLALARRRDPLLRSSLAVILSIAAVAVVEVGVFAAGRADRLLERELLFVLPPLLVGFVAWLGRGAPRPLFGTLVVALVAFAGLIALPMGRLASPVALADNPSLVPLGRLDGSRAEGLTVLFAIVGCALLLWVPARLVWILPVVLGATFVAVAVTASNEFASKSRLAERTLVGPDPHWIDDRTQEAVTYLHDGSRHSGRLAWMQALMNERLTGALDLTVEPVPGPLPQRQVSLLPNSGALQLVDGETPAARVIVAPQGLNMRGRVLARRPGAAGTPGLVLWQLDGAPVVASWTQGLRPNGDLAPGATATLTVFDCGHGSFHVVATGQRNANLTLARNGSTVARFRLRPGEILDETVPTEDGSTRCVLSLTSSSLVRVAELGWQRST